MKPYVPILFLRDRGGSVNPIIQEILLKRAKQLGNLPAMPKILSVLNEALLAPAGQVDIESIVRTISYDESLVAQCLRSRADRDESRRGASGTKAVSGIGRDKCP